MKKVLVTGANGFVGFYVVAQLLQKGFAVIATGKGKSRLPFQDQNLIYEEMDITNKESVISAFQKHRPDIVIHSAAISKPDECELNKELAYTINVQGTIHLLEAAKKQHSFFIFLSTDFVFDGEKGMYKEDDKRQAVNYYGETKVLTEDKVSSYEYDWSIVRTVLVYGASFSGRDNIVTSVAKALTKGEKLSIYDDQVRTPTYVEDLAKAIVTIVEKKATGTFHISGKDIRTPYQIAIEVARHLNLDEKLITKATRATFTQPALRPLKTGFDISKAEKELSYQPISFEEGLRRTFQ
jgi:dTDP-4-dehydrorhamnose reductase